jgi:hypothetical protein
MSALSNLDIHTVDDTYTEVDAFQLRPLKNRNGVFEFAALNSEDTVLDASTVPVYATASVRAGRAADFINNITRVKRKFVWKLRLPIEVPGEDGNIIDYIDVESVISTPVEADTDQLATALVNLNFSITNNGCLLDMVTKGEEPF